MKKVSLLLLCLALLMCLASCGNNTPEATPTQIPATNAPAATDIPAATEASAATEAPVATAVPAPTQAPVATEEPAPTAEPAVPTTFTLGDTGLAVTLPAGWTLMSEANGATLSMYGDETFSTLLQVNRTPIGIGILREQTQLRVDSGDTRDLQDITLAGRTAYLCAATDDSMRHAYISLNDNETLMLLFIVTDPSLFGADQMAEIVYSLTPAN